MVAMLRSPTLGRPTPEPARTPVMRRGVLAVAVVAVGVLAVAIGWTAAGPITTPPHPTAVPLAPITTAPTSAQTATPTPVPPRGRTWSVVVTFYGAADND